MISQIEFRNLKGRTEAIDLGQANLIYGRNFAGKTTIVDAIKLALLGYHPALAKTGQGVMELASGSPMAALAAIGNYVVGNEWTRIGETVRKRPFGPPPGVMPDTPIAALDATDYFGASDRGKVDLIFATAYIKPMDGFVEQTLRAIQDATDQGTAAAVCGLAGGSAARTDQQWLQDAIEGAERRRSEAAAAVRRYTGAVQSATTMAPAPAHFPEDLNERMTKKRVEFEKATTALAVMNADKPPITTAELTQARSRLADLKSKMAQKDLEIGKAVERLAALLAHDNCPMCGTAGEIWREKAKEMAGAEETTLKEERGQLERETYHTAEFIKGWVTALETKQKRWEARDRKKRNILEETIAEHREELAGLEAKIRQRSEAGAIEENRRKAQAEHRQAQADEQRFKAAKAVLLDIKAKLVERVLQPILDTANAFTAGLLRAPLQVEGGNLGYWQEYEGGKSGTWISYRTFSGTEQAIAFCGFQAALAAKAPVKLAILDELGRLDRANKARLLSNVAAALKAGVIEQFIGIDTQAPEKNELGFNLIER